MQEPAYKKKLNQMNQQIVEERGNVAKSQSVMVVNAHNSQSPNTNNSFYTPNKNNTIEGANSMHTANSPNIYPSSNSATNNKVGSSGNNPSSNTNTNNSSIKNNNNGNYQSYSTAQKTNQSQSAKQDIQKRQKQLQYFLISHQKLHTSLQQKSKFLQIEYQKQRVYWSQEKKKYQTCINQLKIKIEEKDCKIQQMMNIIAGLKQQLKVALLKIQQQNKIINDLRKQNGQLKQQSIQIKLENKNLKTDNRVVITHLDKLIKEQNQDKEKTAKQIFQQRQRRVIESLYSKTISTSTSAATTVQTRSTTTSILPSQRNQLSNKLKLDQAMEQFKIRREQSNKMIRKLQQQLKIKERQISNLTHKNKVLQQSIKKISELRDYQRDASKKMKNVISQYEKQFAQISKHNENLTIELEKYWKVPRIKEKIGVISRAKKIRNDQSLTQL